jgi:hypothetical protein
MSDDGKTDGKMDGNSENQSGDETESDRPDGFDGGFGHGGFGPMSPLPPGVTAPNFPQPKFDQPVMDEPLFPQPTINQPNFPKPKFDQPVMDKPLFPQPTINQPNSQPKFDQPTSAQPSFPQPKFDQPGTNQPNPIQLDGPPPAFAGTPPKKKRKWWKIVLGIFLVLALLIGGCTAIVIKAARGVVGEGNKFLSALYKSNDDAMKIACRGAKREEVALLRSELLKQGWVGSKQLNSFSTNSINGVSTGEVSGSVQLTDGPHRVVLTIAKNTDWCVKAAQVDFANVMTSESLSSESSAA